MLLQYKLSSFNRVCSASPFPDLLASCLAVLAIRIQTRFSLTRRQWAQAAEHTWQQEGRKEDGRKEKEEEEEEEEEEEKEEANYRVGVGHCHYRQRFSTQS